MSKLRVIELFGGIGACSKAIERLGIPYEIADYVEIDKYAVKSFNAIHGTNFEPQDIKEWNKDIEADLIMHGSPCQDFSVAGKGAGGDKDSGTRSSLMYETLRIVEKLKPKYVIWENVKNLLSKKHIHNFEAYQEAMKNLGYTNYYQVLNAKDYGVPQNRERVFTVSIRNDICENTFKFPEKIVLEKKLKDILDDEVDEKYYLSEDRLDVIYKWEQRQKENGRGFRFDVKNGDSVGRAVTTGSDRPAETNYVKVERIGGLYDKDGQTHQAGSIYDGGGLSPTLSTMQGGNLEPMVAASRGRNVINSNKTEQQLEPRKDGLTNTITSVQKDNYVAVRTANKKGYDMAKDGDSVDLAYPNSTTRRGRVGHEVSKTLECSDTMGVLIKEENREKRCETNREVLQVLREKIGEKAFQEWALRGLWCILSEAVLWERVYAKGIFESWAKRPELVECAYIGKVSKQTITPQEGVRNMWIDWQDRYPSYRRELSEQQYRELKSLVQKLPHKVASWKEYVQDMWQTSEGLGLLRQALSEIQEIWKSDAHWEVQWPDYRIRKLTPLSCWRLMGFDDSDFEKAEKVNSNSQLYKQAGNSIVVNVLEGILKNLLGNEYGR